MKQLVRRLDGRLAQPMGGLLFWDLCRLFGDMGSLCVAGRCQPSWADPDPLAGLTALAAEMRTLRTR